ncbi:septal ring lytic transglycosylase RlpA family protein [Pseudomonas shirazensis]
MRIKKNITLALFAITFLSCLTPIISQNKQVAETPKIIQDTVKIGKLSVPPVQVDSIFTDNGLKLKAYKKNAHASYYADKFTGRKTANGSRFDNNKYTAAHKKLPFGTRIKVTNEANGKFVIVKITDRGPFVKTRELDLSKRAFMEIAKSRGSGAMKVTIERIIE